MPKGQTDAEMLAALGVDTTPTKKAKRTPKEERIIAGFEEIVRFTKEHGAPPQHGEDRDIFERLYAVRLDRIRQSKECRKVLEGMDEEGLLGEEHSEEPLDIEGDDEALLAALGADGDASSDITKLKHVKSRAEIKAAEEVAKRETCRDFDVFRPLFESVQQELESGERKTLKFKDNAEVKKGDLFILDGQKIHVAEEGELFINDYDRQDRRLRVIYDNGTESDILMRSLQRALNKDKTSRRITDPTAGPLFSSEEEEGDLATGYIYILRSLSEEPFIAENREVIHKIGVTGGDVKKRVANAKKDPTYLLADVEIVQTFKLANINRKGVESLLHRFFAEVRLDVSLKDRFDQPVEPKEWFLVPLPVIEEAISLLVAGTMADFSYDPEKGVIVKR